MSSGRSHWLKAALSLGLAAVLLVLFFRNLDFGQVVSSIQNADAGWLVAALIVSLSVIPIRSWRWTRLLAHVGKIRQMDSISATCIGFAATTLLPARAGEVVRPVALARISKLPVSPLLASVGLERLIDLICVLFLFLVYAFGGFLPRNLGSTEEVAFLLLQKSAVLGGIASIILLFIVGIFAVRKDLREKGTEWFLKRLPHRLADRIRPVVKGLLRGLDALASPSNAAILAVSSLIMWFVISLQIYTTLRAFHFDFPIPVSFFLLAWAVLGLAVPTPGGVGGYHKALAYALTGFYGAVEAHAAAFALISHAISFVPITVLGLGFLIAGGLSFGKLGAGDEPPIDPKPPDQP